MKQVFIKKRPKGNKTSGLKQKIKLEKDFPQTLKKPAENLCYFQTRLLSVSIIEEASFRASFSLGASE